MTAAKKKPAKEPKPEEVDAGPEVSTAVSWNGLNAVDTIDGVEQPVRAATLAEQLEMHADEVLRLVVGTVPYAASGSVDVDGSTLTITLTSH